MEDEGRLGRKREDVGRARLGRRAGDIMWRPSLGPVVRDLEKCEPVSALCSQRQRCLSGRNNNEQ